MWNVDQCVSIFLVEEIVSECGELIEKKGEGEGEGEGMVDMGNDQ